MSERRSAWHNFRGAALSVMRAPDRLHHPTRAIVDDLMRQWFGSRRFEWLDVGVIGMVDYERLRRRMRFRFVGADMSQATVADARSYLHDGADDVVVWDVEAPPPPPLRGRFDLVTLRHLLNHCTYYDRPLEHVAMTLRPGGRVVVVLHLGLIEGPDRLLRHEQWEVEGEVIGNRYAREPFFAFFSRLFVPELWVRVETGHKPNDVIVGRLAPRRDAAPSPPAKLTLRMPPGRRYLLHRAIARARLRIRVLAGR